MSDVVREVSCLCWYLVHTQQAQTCGSVAPTFLKQQHASARVHQEVDDFPIGLCRIHNSPPSAADAARFHHKVVSRFTTIGHEVSRLCKYTNHSSISWVSKPQHISIFRSLLPGIFLESEIKLPQKRGMVARTEGIKPLPHQLEGLGSVMDSIWTLWNHKLLL